jgi:uncharacterized protein YecT (DUF1311 family)
MLAGNTGIVRAIVVAIGASIAFLAPAIAQETIRNFDIQGFLTRQSAPGCANSSKPEVRVHEVIYGDFNLDGKEDAAVSAASCSSRGGESNIAGVFTLENQGVQHIPMQDISSGKAQDQCLFETLVGKIQFRYRVVDGALAQVWQDESAIQGPLTVKYSWDGSRLAVSKVRIQRQSELPLTSFGCRAVRTLRQRLTCRNAATAAAEVALHQQYRFLVENLPPSVSSNLTADQQAWVHALDAFAESRTDDCGLARELQAKYVTRKEEILKTYDPAGVFPQL